MLSPAKNIFEKSFQYGEHTIKLQTNMLAKQATSAVVASMNNTSVLVTLVVKETVDPACDFFPLTVHYQERAYAAGRIPGNFFRREGRPSESEILNARIMDRAIRPLFPKDFKNEVQIVVTVLSLDRSNVGAEILPDIIALIGVSTAVSLSGLPFKGPVGVARIGVEIDNDNNQFMLNPSPAQLKSSQLDLIIAGNTKAIVMVEASAKQINEAQILAAIEFGYQQQQILIKNISQFVAEVGQFYQFKQQNGFFTDDIVMFLRNMADEIEKKLKTAALNFNSAHAIAGKIARHCKIVEINTHAKNEISHTLAQAAQIQQFSLDKILSSLEKSVARKRIFQSDTNNRIAGRSPNEIRDISISLDLLQGAHGSACFTRGETQALVVVTLGTEKDAQIIDGLSGESTDQFLLHYNFPPYCVGETGMVGSPKRREIGHGHLAKKALLAVMPTKLVFPRTVRVVAEITESDGSSSMATVCGASLALMAAGVPIANAVAGVAMGLIKEGEKYIVLSDICGEEDYLGDMDFKVAGTSEGVTALQMDIKVEGITIAILHEALQHAKSGRLNILAQMNKIIAQSRAAVSASAPIIHIMDISVDKIKNVIGKGGCAIRALHDEAGVGCAVDIKDNGKITISAKNEQQVNVIITRIEQLIAEVKVGHIYTGIITKIVDFGAFVAIDKFVKEGLIHISQIAQHRVENIEEYLTVGQAVSFKILEIDPKGKIRCSMKESNTTQ